jgi:hypothetical protein
LQVVGVYFGTLVLHEAVHGLAFMLFSAKPTFGIGLQGKILPYAYATAPKAKLTFGQMMIVGLAPFVLLSVVFLSAGRAWPAAGSYIAVAFVTNFAGAVGDLWIMSKLWRFRACRSLRVSDDKTGLTIYSDDPAAAKIIKDDKLKQQAKRRGFINHWLKIFCSLVAISLVVPMILSLINYTGTIQLGAKEFYLFDYSASENSLEVGLNLIPLGLAALVGAGIWKLVPRLNK